MSPIDVYELTIEEYNYYMRGVELRQKENVANAIMVGFYAAYYTNGGKKAKRPKELIDQLYVDKQSYSDGIEELNRLKKMKF